MSRGPGSVLLALACALIALLAAPGADADHRSRDARRASGGERSLHGGQPILAWLGKPLTGGTAVPDAGSAYHGVYPGGVTGWEDDISIANVDAYEAAAGDTHVAWVYFSNNWFNQAKRAFPSQLAENIGEHGSVPFIRLMLRDKQDPVRDAGPYPLRRITRGDWDRDLRRWGKAAADYGGPLIVDFGVEMNGKWFSWNAKWNGGADVGPRRFRAAYRHVHDVIESRGPDVTWVFHVNDEDDPKKPWNRFERYYPGDGYVDWVGFSAYGALTPCDDPEDWGPFADAAATTVDRLAELAPDKPIFVFEFGTTEGNPAETASAWADPAFAALLSDPRLRGFSWWNETWENGGGCEPTDMRVQESAALQEVFERHLVDNDQIEQFPLTP